MTESWKELSKKHDDDDDDNDDDDDGECANALPLWTLDTGNKMEYDEQVMVDIHLAKSYRFRWV